MMRFVSLSLLFVFLALTGCARTSTADDTDARVLLLGDSVFAWSRASGRSVGDEMARLLAEPVDNRSVLAARVSHPAASDSGLHIPNQLPATPVDWIVVNGGANDLYFECLCLRCEAKITQLVSPDGLTGEIPRLLAQFRATGAQVLYVGYHRSGGIAPTYDRCTRRLDPVEDRLAQFAAQTDGVHFVDMTDVFAPRDSSYYFFDRIHPSAKGSTAIAARIADTIQTIDASR